MVVKGLEPVLRRQRGLLPRRSLPPFPHSPTAHRFQSRDYERSAFARRHRSHGRYHPMVVDHAAEVKRCSSSSGLLTKRVTEREREEVGVRALVGEAIDHLY